ncbi:MAG: hypothetical protein KA354_19715 [Phycisphaerae bacterium]|nr:hypothetical protein [Phycisphaerae bacterium]
MTNFYLDIETTGIDAQHDHILTIQFQPLDRSTGQPIGTLRILKAWESSEKEILDQFIAEVGILDPYPFAFIPVGFNLMFEHNFLRARSVAHGLPEIDILARPFIDLKAVGVLMRHGEFKGTSLDALTGKQGNGSQISVWYAARDFGAIVRYIEQEAREFIRFYAWLCARMPVLRSEWMRECSREARDPEVDSPATPAVRSQAGNDTKLQAGVPPDCGGARASRFPTNASAEQAARWSAYPRNSTAPLKGWQSRVESHPSTSTGR